MGNFLGDIRLAIRRMRRTPTFTASALLILILSIGANSTIFTVVSRYLLEPLPVERPSELVTINRTSPNGEQPTHSYLNYQDLRDRATTVSDIAGYSVVPVVTSTGETNGRAYSYLVSGNYFEMLGVPPMLGRVLGPSDDLEPGGHAVAVLAYGFWQRRFGGDEDAIGSQMKLNGLDYTIAGVMPEGFYGTERILIPDLFVPIMMAPEIIRGVEWLDSRANRNTYLIARLNPGATRAQLQSELDALAAGFEREFPGTDQGAGFSLTDPGLFGSFLAGPMTAAGSVLLVLAGMVLLVACANIAGLLLARATGRSKETAIRLAVGASRWALLRESITESLVLCTLAGAGGILLAVWLSELISAWTPPVPIPLVLDFAVDSWVVANTILLSLAAAILCGLAPGLQAARANLSSALKQELRTERLSRFRPQDLLAASQVALSTILLIGALLVVVSLDNTMDVPVGFDPTGVSVVSLDPVMEGYAEDARMTLERDLLDRARAIPGVQSVALAGALPLGMEQYGNTLFIDSTPEPPPGQVPQSLIYAVGEEYFATMRTPLVAGRPLDQRDQDPDAPPTAVVNQIFVDRHLNGREPIGARFHLGDGPSTEIVGVAEDGKYTWLTEGPQTVVYLPMYRNPGFTTVIARSTLPESQILPRLREVVLGINPAISLFYDGNMERRVDFQFLPARFLAGALSSFGILAVLLVMAGLYGIVAYTVAQRTKEIGIRMALGAEPGTVIRTVVARAAFLVATGTLIGVAGGLALGQVFAQVFFGVNPFDPLVLAGSISMMLVIGAAACVIPARRAINIDPLTALRGD